MSYPYLGDVINTVWGIQWTVPIPMFGSFVAMAILVALKIAESEVIRLENLGALSNAKISNKKGTSASYVPSHEIVNNMGMLAALFGIVGARLFHILEYPQQYLHDPGRMIFSQGGFSIYGGLIIGAMAGIVYLRKRDVAIRPMLDAFAPAMILGYAIGRIGCQISGDGDWGIISNMSLKPDWLPNWLWAQTYENNIVGLIIQSPGVYPTPLYETAMALCIFVSLWLLRKSQHKPGYLFSVYLLLSGYERLLIEKIRINSSYHLWGLEFTQAEFISVVLIILGAIGILITLTSNFIPKIVFSFLALGGLSACVIW